MCCLQWRRPLPSECGQFGQCDGQLLLRYRHWTTGPAMHHRNGCAPVALSGYQPVSELGAGKVASHLVFLGLLDNGVQGLLPSEATELQEIGPIYWLLCCFHWKPGQWHKNEFKWSTDLVRILQLLCPICFVLQDTGPLQVQSFGHRQILVTAVRDSCHAHTHTNQ